MSAARAPASAGARGFAGPALVGAVAAVLLAAFRGREARSKLGHEDRYQRLAQWVRDAGGFVSDALEYVEVSEKGAMLRAGVPIASGERLLMIPGAVHVSEGNIRKSSAALARHVDSIHNLSLARNGVSLTAAWLSTQYEKHARSPSLVGDWGAYWDMFSPPSSMPFYRNKTEMIALFGSYEFQEVGRQEFWYKRDHELITGPCKASHCEAADVGRMGLGTFQAMNQHILSHAYRGPGDRPHIIPVFELLNHAPERAATSTYEFSSKTGDVEVVARTSIRQGDEVTITYGRNSNPERVASWGFADPPFVEPFWSVKILYKTFFGTYFPRMITDDMEIDLRLATRWHSSLPPETGVDSADVALRTLREDLGLARGDVPSFLEVIEAVAEHFLKWYRQDRVVASFREALEARRAVDPSSSVWWTNTPEAAQRFSRSAFAEELTGAQGTQAAALWQEAEEADLSNPRHVGSFWVSTVVRLKMSEYLCALAYKEALMYLRGELEEREVMAESLEAAADLLKHTPEHERPHKSQ